jgi:hypothetical protein
MTDNEDRVQEIYSLLNLNPEEVNNKVFSMRGISIKNKISIIVSCLNDNKSICLNHKDPKDRYRAIKKAGQSLQQLVAKTRITDGIC